MEIKPIGPSLQKLQVFQQNQNSRLNKSSAPKKNMGLQDTVEISKEAKLQFKKSKISASNKSGKTTKVLNEVKSWEDKLFVKVGEVLEDKPLRTSPHLKNELE